MKYKILLFDLDDTLLDFGANEKDSLKKLFQQHGYTFSDELYQIYNFVNKQLWADYENGMIGLQDVLNSRFSETMRKLGKIVDGVEWENLYRELLGNGCQPMEGAFDVCQRFSLSHRLFVITNGVTKTQIKRLKQSGLHDFFETGFRLGDGLLRSTVNFGRNRTVHPDRTAEDAVHKGQRLGRGEV